MKNQNRIVFFVGIIVLLTIVIQFYWNYVQYKNNRQQVENEIQISLDNAVDNYYTELSKETMFAYAYESEKKDTNALNSLSEVSSRITSMRSDTLVKGKPKTGQEIEKLSKHVKERTFKSFLMLDSINDTNQDINSIGIFRGKQQIDSLDFLGDAVIKVVMAVKFDSINFTELKKKIDTELERKNIKFDDYFLVQTSKFEIPMDSLGTSDSIRFPFTAVSNSALLPNYSNLEMHYPNIFWITLKKGTTGILLSLVLSGAVIFSLFYLLHIIRKQKQLSEIKNDFISNITHELKTPIATVTSAVEGLQNFNEDNNPEKSQKYLEVSSQQLEKLKILVEKIMETSVLESKDLILEKENTDLVRLIQNTIEEHKINTLKTIVFDSNTNEFIYNTDVFHFENAISNLIENAIKYGGNKINIRFDTSENKTIIEISDNGNGISATHQKSIFDKFYRIPTKNTHNIKGFGIGLYYTKNIIEKHNGTIELKSDKTTTFRIVLIN